MFFGPRLSVIIFRLCFGLFVLVRFVWRTLFRFAFVKPNSQSEKHQDDYGHDKERRDEVKHTHGLCSHLHHGRRGFFHLVMDSPSNIPAISPATIAAIKRRTTTEPRHFGECAQLVSASHCGMCSVQIRVHPTAPFGSYCIGENNYSGDPGFGALLVRGFQGLSPKTRRRW
jgi:hypothetical protein